MKRCAACGEVKPADDFMWHRKSEGQRDCYCRPCRAEYKKAHYAANKQRYIDNAQIWKGGQAVRRTTWLIEYFETHPCVDCGEADPVVLQFDHRRDKCFDVSVGVINKSWREVLAEIEKCEVRCANCHRRRTAREGGFYRVLMVGWHRVGESNAWPPLA